MARYDSLGNGDLLVLRQGEKQRHRGRTGGSGPSAENTGRKVGNDAPRSFTEKMPFSASGAARPHRRGTRLSRFKISFIEGS